MFFNYIFIPYVLDSLMTTHTDHVMACYRWVEWKLQQTQDKEQGIVLLHAMYISERILKQICSFICFK